MQLISVFYLFYVEDLFKKTWKVVKWEVFVRHLERRSSFVEWNWSIFNNKKVKRYRDIKRGDCEGSENEERISSLQPSGEEMMSTRFSWIRATSSNTESISAVDILPTTQPARYHRSVQVDSKNNTPLTANYKMKI